MNIQDVQDGTKLVHTSTRSTYRTAKTANGVECQRTGSEVVRKTYLVLGRPRRVKRGFSVRVVDENGSACKAIIPTFVSSKTANAMSTTTKTRVYLAVNLSRGTWGKGTTFLKAVLAMKRESETCAEDRVCLRAVEAADPDKVRVGPMGNLQHMPGDEVLGEGRRPGLLGDWQLDAMSFNHHYSLAAE